MPKGEQSEGVIMEVREGQTIRLTPISEVTRAITDVLLPEHEIVTCWSRVIGLGLASVLVAGILVFYHDTTSVVLGLVMEALYATLIVLSVRSLTRERIKYSNAKKAYEAVLGYPYKKI
jgi:hypothetical protein